MADDSAFKASRPTIAVGGKDNPALTEGLLTLLIAEDTNGLYRCEASFSNWGTKDGRVDFLYFDRKTLDFGKTFSVKLAGSSRPLFDGRIMALEARFGAGNSPEITVLAEDRFQDLRMTQRTRSFDDMSDANIISKVAAGHGLTAQVNLSGPTYKVVAQVNQSDLAFLRERARAVDAELWMEGSVLHAQSRSQRNGGTFALKYQQNLREFTVMADIARQRTSVTVSGWNVAGKDALKYEAKDDVISGELNGDTSGSRVLSSALGDRKEALVHTVPLTDAEARAEAEAVFRMTARQFVRGHGVADTNAAIAVGSFVDLQELGPLFTGKYYLSAVHHIFNSASGLRSEFTAERPGLGKAG